MSLLDKKISISKLLSYFLIFDLLTREEMEHARKTGFLPRDIMDRLKMAQVISKN
jgi:hypothetical protein